MVSSPNLARKVPWRASARSVEPT